GLVIEVLRLKREHGLVLWIFSQDVLNQLARGFIFLVQRRGGWSLRFVPRGHFINERFKGRKLARRQVLNILGFCIEALELSLCNPTTARILLIQTDNERRYRERQDAGFQNVVHDVNRRTLGQTE